MHPDPPHNWTAHLQGLLVHNRRKGHFFLHIWLFYYSVEFTTSLCLLLQIGGRGKGVTLAHILWFTTGLYEAPLLRFKLHPTLHHLQTLAWMPLLCPYHHLISLIHQTSYLIYTTVPFKKATLITINIYRQQLWLLAYYFSFKRKEFTVSWELHGNRGLKVFTILDLFFEWFLWYVTCWDFH